MNWSTHGVDGLIVPPGHAAPIVEAIEILLAAPERARDMAAQARRRVEGDLSFASRTRRVEAIYEELATRTRDQRVHHASAPV